MTLLEEARKRIEDIEKQEAENEQLQKIKKLRDVQEGKKMRTIFLDNLKRKYVVFNELTVIQAIGLLTNILQEADTMHTVELNTDDGTVGYEKIFREDIESTERVSYSIINQIYADTSNVISNRLRGYKEVSFDDLEISNCWR